MKLKSLREHYKTKDGKTWTPKTGYQSEEEVRAQGFHSDKYIVYLCSQCNEFHISGVRKNNA